jgi:hypothetical protein
MEDINDTHNNSFGQYMTEPRAKQPAVDFQQWKRFFFFSTQRLDRLWGPPSLLPVGYQGFFHWEYSDRAVRLTTHLHLRPESERVELATPPIPQTSSWYGV